MDKLSIIWARLGITAGIILALIHLAGGQVRWGIAYLLMTAWWAWTYRDNRRWWAAMKVEREKMRAWGKIAGIKEPEE